MNYKPSNKIASQYVVLSYFHRGLFWGTVFAWTAVTSGACGAAITKAFYLDKREIVLDQGYGFFGKSQSAKSLSSDFVLETKSSMIPVSVDYSELQIGESPAVVADNFLLSPHYWLADQISLQDSMSLISLFSVFDSSIITAFDSFSLTYRTPSLKDFKITIYNTTNEPNLAKQVYSYLQERDFSDIAIAEPTLLNLNQTTITAEVQNLEAANYLKSTLSLGILDLVNHHSLDNYSESELIIHLGKDAKSFATNQNFIEEEE